MSERTLYVTRLKEDTVLFPADKASEELIRKLPPGRVILVRSKSARNGKHHRLLWKTAAIIAENSEIYEDAEHVVEQLKLATGHVKRTAYNLPGLGMVEQIRGASISYEAMSQEDFAIWFDKAVTYIVNEMIPGLSSGGLRQELMERLGVDDWPERMKA